MTERLKQMLDGEAHGLSVPPPATDAVLRQGRGLRRRNRLVTGAAGVAAAVVVGSGVIALTGGSDNNAAPDPAGSPVGTNPVFSYGNEVFYDGPGHRTAIDDAAVKSLFYTSTGVLVRHGDNSWSDGGGPQRFSLITPGGDVQPLRLVNEETVHASDPDQPYVVYGEAVDGELHVVVYDVATDTEEARVSVGRTRETWFPVALDGDTAYVQDRSRDETYAVDWRAGTAEPSDVASTWEVAGGRAATEADGRPAVVDVAESDVLLTTEGPGYFDLSPDGRYAQLVDEEGGGPTFEVYDVATGEPVTLEGNPFEWGWTADGDMFKVDDNRVTTCDSATGECTVESYSQPSIPEPAPITDTVSDPVCPDEESLACYDDEAFLGNCYENPDDCEWRETKSVTPMTIETKLAGRAYES
jgi:hypothetical protein